MTGNHPHILIVDDNEQNLVAVAAVLEPLGALVVRANSGEEALLHVLRQDFALILLDAQMPIMDGYETATLIRRRERSAKTPIIFLTAIDKSPAQMFRGYAAGAVDFIFKPFEPEVLRSKVSVFIDIFNLHRELEEQAERLRVSEERYALAAVGASDGLWDWDLKSDEVYYSPRWAEIAGYSEMPLPNHITAWFDRIEPEDIQQFELVLGEHLQGRSPHFEVEHRMHSSSGEERWVLARGLAIRDADGVPVRMAGSLSDITARKQAEAESRQKERLAVIGMTVANVSHSMKNIFTALRGSMSLLERMLDLSDANLQQVFGILQSSSQRLNLMIMNMLDFSKEREPVRELVEMPYLFGVLEGMLQASARKKGVALEFNVDPGAAQVIHDSERLLRCLMNLGGNALDAIEQGDGRIAFRAVLGLQYQFGLSDAEVDGRAAADPAILLIEVSDNGSGISPENLARIFEPFFSTKGSRGTGLGLLSVREFVHECGGLLRVDSTEDVGTTFRMYFFNCLASELARLDSVA